MSKQPVKIPTARGEIKKLDPSMAGLTGIRTGSAISFAEQSETFSAATDQTFRTLVNKSVELKPLLMQDQNFVTLRLQKPMSTRMKTRKLLRSVQDQKKHEK